MKQKLGYSFKFISIYFTLGGIIGGYLLSVIAGAAASMAKDLSLSTNQLSTIMGLILFGGLIAKLILLFNDYFGRKKIIYATLILFIVGNFIFTAAHSYEMLYWGRLTQGIAAIMSTVVFTVYLSEVAPTKKRGAMITVFQLAWTAGILIGSLVNWGFSGSDDWRTMFNIITVLPVILLFVTPLLPDSPRFFALKGNIPKAEEIIKGMNAGSLSEQELNAELRSLFATDKIDWKTSLKSIYRFKKAVMFAAFILILTQLCGINAIIQTSTIIIHDCGIKSPAVATFGSVMVALVNFLMTIGTIIFVDRIGRKKILIIGLVGFALSMLCLVLVLTLITPGLLAGSLALVCILSAVSFLAFGPCGVVYVLVAEVLPNAVRTNGIILAGFMAVIVGTVFVSKFLLIAEKFGYPMLFGMICFFSVVYLFFAIFVLPETGGKSLEEIEKEM